MSDNNNLNDYGVWVKKPPRTIDSSNENNEDPFDNFDIATDLPDFSELDENINNTVETNEMGNSEEDILNQQDEEISLDEFITDGIFESGPDEEKIKEKEAAMASSAPQAQTETQSSETEDVSIGDFVGEDETQEESAPAETASFDDSDDDTLNIDLSFDDDNSVPMQEESVSADSFSFDDDIPATSDDGSESVDLSEFGITEFTDPNPQGETPTKEQTSQADSFDTTETSNDSSSGETEDVDMSEFGIDFSDDDSQSATTEETQESTDENVIDETSEGETDSQVEIDSSLDSPDMSSNFDIDSEGEESVDVSSDDFTVEEDSEEPVSPQQTSSFSQENDDFDLDDIMNSVEDESGRTVTVGDQVDAVVKEVSDIPDESTQIQEEEQIQSEEIKDFTDTSDDNINFDSIPSDIPDTFDEEAASLTADELSNIATSVVSDETPMEQTTPPASQDSSQVANTILQDIVGQLSALKTEISTLKNDLTNLKNNNAVLPTSTEQTEDTGFFSDTNGDNTIALSSDEMANIFNTAEITEETVDSQVEQPTSQEQDIYAGEDNNSSDFSTDFSMNYNENVEEPDLDKLESDQQEEEINSELPDEIAVPKVEDLIVDSSSTDLMDSGETTMNAQEPVLDDMDIEDVDSDVESELNEEQINTEQIADVADSFDDSYENDSSFSDTLTEDKLSYLENDENSNIDNYEATSESTEIDSTSEESAQEDNESSIPTELKTEIKSVLSYMDQLLENLPEDKIAEFAQSDQFETYKKLFKELGLS